MAIQHIGSATGTTTATIPAHAAGDLFVLRVFRSGSTTQPTVPTSSATVPAWVTPTNGTVANNTASSRVVTFRATASNHTTGTWTNASRVVIDVYRSTTGATLSAGACTVGSGASSTVTFPALTLTAAGSSWVHRSFGHRLSTTAPTPTGYTQRGVTTGGNPMTATYDSGAVVATSPGTATITASTSSGFHAFSLEVMEAQPSKASTVTDLSTFTRGADWTLVGSELRGAYGTAYTTATTPTTFDLTGSQVVAEVIHSTAHANNESWMAFGEAGGVFDAANTLQMIVSAGVLYARERAAGTSTDASTTYDPVAMRFWRLREAAGTVYWETAPAVTGPWTVQRSKASAWTPSSHFIKFSAGNFTAAQTSYLAIPALNPPLPPTTGAVTGGALAWSGAVVGSSPQRGTVTGTRTVWTSTATGAAAYGGETTPGALTWATAAEGATQPHGTVDGTLTWAADIVGQAPAEDTAAGTVDGGTLTWVAAATGDTDRDGTITGGELTWGTTATGTTTHTGTVSGGAVAWAAGITGASTHTGTVTGGTLEWDAAAVGSTTHTGATTPGALTWAANVTGSAPVIGVPTGQVTGGTLTWGATTAGTTDRAGALSGALAWSTVVTGDAPGIPSATGTIDGGALAWDTDITGEHEATGGVGGGELTWLAVVAGLSPLMGVARDITVTVTGPTSRSFTANGPIGRAIRIGTPTRAPLTFTGPRSD